MKKTLIYQLSPIDGLLPNAKSLYHQLHSESFFK